MKVARLLAAGGLVLASLAASADEVVAEKADNTVGAGFGGGIGVLLGGALGGPAGALLGAGVGALTGWGVQDASGLSQNAYVVKAADGSESRVRSPNGEFQVGQVVEKDGIRLRAGN
ncbi:hypothetical protein D3C76_716140 [compost metagenome]|uniref:Outer membrane lipoprotein SlyB n=1 Tax=Pseudomonas jinjuensis TaxID=198616 RepID=A0A1H0MPB7_9PSED|nr:hypothetical protein [Pseudomonas jinjuensis]SDO82278.1 hypothetical protein SAMN05216193_11684 [Pseudomonas jinjuensis]